MFSLARTVARGAQLNGAGITMRAFSHKAETDAEFNAKWVAFFKGTEDLGELHRGLQNVFSYDLVPSAEIITEAIKASRQYNDYPTAVRVLEGLKKKVENPGQYQAYLTELKPLLTELGVEPREVTGI